MDICIKILCDDENTISASKTKDTKGDHLEDVCHWKLKYATVMSVDFHFHNDRKSSSSATFSFWYRTLLNNETLLQNSSSLCLPSETGRQIWNMSQWWIFVCCWWTEVDGSIHDKSMKKILCWNVHVNTNHSVLTHVSCVTERSWFSQLAKYITQKQNVMMTASTMSVS